jgi:thioredoxin-related protein
MKKLLFAAVIVLLSSTLHAQNTAVADGPKLYNPAANAKNEISEAVKKAAKENKNVLLQLGGNWCVWCLRFNDLVTGDAELNKYMNNNYVVLHVNYSPENKNEEVLASLGYPQRFGFPVFVVLDGKGNRLHTQNSAYLEEGKGHSKAKVMEFFKGWAPAAVDPKSYANVK